MPSIVDSSAMQAESCSMPAVVARSADNGISCPPHASDSELSKSVDLPTATTRNPRHANAVATARPIPREAPVTMYVGMGRMSDVESALNDEVSESGLLKILLRPAFVPKQGTCSTRSLSTE